MILKQPQNIKTFNFPQVALLSFNLILSAKRKTYIKKILVAKLTEVVLIKKRHTRVDVWKNNNWRCHSNHNWTLAKKHECRNKLLRCEHNATNNNNKCYRSRPLHMVAVPPISCSFQTMNLSVLNFKALHPYRLIPLLRNIRCMFYKTYTVHLSKQMSDSLRPRF